MEKRYMKTQERNDLQDISKKARYIVHYDL